ncbi:MAG TPA: tyrosine-type recombinase/integrase [Terriglobales bacterium]|nr:tyrosine-type recombinase/integrase [Terriglobales bacterium]
MIENALFKDASEIWLRRKRQSVSERTGWDYETYLRPVLGFFGEMRLAEINIDHIVEYRAARLSTAGPDRINHECNTLQQILTGAGLWAPIAQHYKPMKRPRGTGAGRRVGPEELRHLLEVASGRTKWRIAYLCTLVEVSTGCGPSEVLHLRLGDIDQTKREIRFIEGTKTIFRKRDLPMNDDCLWAVQQLEAIARDKGATAPEHYLVLGRATSRGGHADPTRPATSYKRAWYSLRKEAAKKFPALAGVRRYDMRHTSLSMMAENPNVDAATFEKVAGWGPGSRMLAQRYHHEIRLRKEICVSAVNGFRPGSSAGA